ncbi:coiled-coil domain-containing protein 157-like [Saccoglossus kowalevskii]|uniref:Coiled-coil domain-containing protein 157-like n=1 Tax=Saccoglossus kowalevskii TaxID=10224 RepID=A0ABM0GLI2_SACKO|nr:PREDICTED: coiled-coil domain-containing protein 157-like [Saccoglossus kowalevskii]
MASLLGSKLCIESLSSDVADLQETINEVFSRVGPVRFPSWKFPDKVSSDVNIAELLEEYVYDDADDEDSQVSHIMMYELTIDRLMLLMQSFTRFIEQLLGVSSPGNNHVGSQMSVGLATKKFWHKMIQVYTMLQQQQSENKSKSRTIVKLENAIGELHEENERLKPQDVRASGMFHMMTQSSSFHPSNPPKSLGDIIPPNITEDPFRPRTAQRYEIAKEVRTVPCQTHETAFVPCQACACVQLSLKEVSGMIIDVCKTQGLPSAVAKHKAHEHSNVLSASDVSRWTAEQNKDLARINKHLENLMSTIEPMKVDLAASQAMCEQLSQQVSNAEKNIKKEKDKQSSLIKCHESKVKEIERTHADSVSIIKRTNLDLKSGKQKLEDQMSNLKRELVRQQDALQDLETTNKSLVKDLDEKSLVASRVGKLEKSVQEMKSELQTTQMKLESTTKELSKEQAKSRSISKHDQAVQSKHESLLQRVDELDQECEELKGRVIEMEDEKEELESTRKEVKRLQRELQEEKELMAQIAEDKKSIETSIHDLQSMILKMEDELQESKEREIQLVQYPDLNVSSLPPEAMPETTGDIATDMARQIQANNIRIQIMQEHNESLRQTVDKLRLDKPAKHQTFQSSGPVPLWKRGDTQQENNGYQERNQQQKSQKHWSAHSQSEQQRDLYTFQHAPNDGFSIGASHSNPELQSDTGYTRPSKNSPTDDDRFADKPPVHRNISSAKTRKGERNMPPTSVNVAKLAAQGNTSLSAYLKLKSAGSIPTKGGDNKTRATRPRSGKANFEDVQSNLSLRIDIPGSREGSAKGGRDSHSTSKPKSRQGGWMSALAGKKPTEQTERYTPVDMFVCSACDKMYTTQKDLDVHKSYCYG